MNKLNKLLFLGTFIFVLAIAQTISFANNSQIEQAKEFYQQGKYLEAIELLETAIDDRNGTIENVIALRNLALVYQKLGEWQNAKSALDSAEKVIATIKDEPQKNNLLAQVLEVRGQIELSLGRFARSFG